MSKIYIEQGRAGRATSALTLHNSERDQALRGLPEVSQLISDRVGPGTQVCPPQIFYCVLFPEA